MATVVQDTEETSSFLKQDLEDREANDADDDVFELQPTESCKTTVIPPSPPSIDPLADTYRVKISKELPIQHHFYFQNYIWLLRLVIRSC